MITLPENWDDLDLNEKKNWLIRHAAGFLREGEVTGTNGICTEEVIAAWKKYMEEQA